jgi:hypothetical protein
MGISNALRLLAAAPLADERRQSELAFKSQVIYSFPSANRFTLCGGLLTMLKLPNFVLTFGLWMLAVSPGMAADASGSNQTADKKLILAFRMQNWKTQHLNDASQAQKQVTTLKQLGCEVKQSQHNGHIDVAWRTVLWKSLALDSQEQLQQWKSWLDLAGFDTLHGRTPVTGGEGPREIVKYRLVEWRAQHVHQPQEVGQLTTLYRALGCEIESSQHSGHTDLRLRCPNWLEIELPTHDAAHQWQAFLDKAGFETQHEH